MTDTAPSFTSDDLLTGAAQGRLRSFIERLDRLTDDKQVINNDFAEVLAEAAGEGFSKKILRKVLAIHRADKAKLSEEEALVDLYLSALGDA